jgi:Phage integrase, N-terminal SAM-like domain
LFKLAGIVLVKRGESMIDEEKTNEEKKSRSRKQKRRGKGEGSIYPDKKNDRWVGSFFTEDGKRRYVYGKTQEEAREKLRAAQHADKQGLLATGPQQTMEQFLDYWLEEVHKPTIRISSYIRYRGILDNQILPALGHIRLQRLTVQHVESFYARLAKEKAAVSKQRGKRVQTSACCPRFVSLDSLEIPFYTRADRSSTQ